MRDWVKTALTRKIRRKGARGGERVVAVQPNAKVVLLVKFALFMTTCLSGLEIAHLAFLHVWSSEVFAAITGLIGTVTGVLIGHHT